MTLREEEGLLRRFERCGSARREYVRLAGSSKSSVQIQVFRGAAEETTRSLEYSNRNEEIGLAMRPASLFRAVTQS